jgi:hypothetical protein
MAEERMNLTVRVPFRAEEIIAEARRWDVSNEVGLRVLDAATTSVVASSPRGRQFLEHLLSMQRGGYYPPSGHAAHDGHRTPVFRAVPSGAWIEIVKLAERVAGDVASHRRVDTAAALKLAHAIRLLGNADEATSGIIERPAGVARRPQ